MKKLYLLLIALFTIITLPGLQTQAFDIPLNYGVSDNDEAFVQTKNLLNITNVETQTINGITIQSLGNNEFIINGTVSMDSRIGIYNEINYQTSFANILANTNEIPITIGLNYSVSADLISGTISSSVLDDLVFVDSGLAIDNYILSTQTSTATTTASENNGHLYIFARAGTIYNNFRIKIQLELGSTATSYAPYGFLSLNDIFVDGQLFSNADFDTDITGGWSLNNSTSGVTDGIVTLTGDGTNTRYRIIINTNVSLGNKIFISTRIKVNNSISTKVEFGNSGWTGGFETENNPIENQWLYLYGSKIVLANSFLVLDTYYSSNADQNGSSSSIDYIIAYDLNALGIDHLEQIDNLYQDWLRNNIYDEGFTNGEQSTTAYASGFDTGYTTGYNDGYGDAVEEDNAYSLGYALGLSEGQDMETGSSIIVLVLAALSFAFMLFGFTSRKRIFNLFAVGLFIVLGGLLFEYPAFIIVTIGFVIVNLYYTFVSD